MARVAIIGAGPIGGALASTLARRGRVRDVRLIDAAGTVAQGKALDILQSSPVEQFSTNVSAATDYAAAVGSEVIVVADVAAGTEVAGETGLTLVRQLAQLEKDSPLLFAGAGQHELMQRTLDELHVARNRVLGSAALALESAVRAITAALIDVSAVEIAIGIAGVPPHDFVIGWDAATAFNQPIARILAPHHAAALSAKVSALWPPGAYTLASAAARVAEALALGTRRRFTCLAAADVAGVGRGMIAAVPVEIVKGGIGKVLEPALSRHERTAFENGFS
jgi:malate dehydrogenase